jgi:hypothetical protein
MTVNLMQRMIIPDSSSNSMKDVGAVYDVSTNVIMIHKR